jgi:hypothetical protein
MQNPDPDAPYYLSAAEVHRLKDDGTFHFYVNFYDQNNPSLIRINPSPAYRPHVSSGAAGPIKYIGYYYDPEKNELHATSLMSDAFIDQYLQWRLLSYISNPMVVASMPDPSSIKNPGHDWILVPEGYKRASQALSPFGVSMHTFEIQVSGVGQ